MRWLANGGIGTLIFILFVVATALADAWKKRKVELARRESMTPRQREAAERRVPAPEARSVVMDEKPAPPVTPPLAAPVEPPRTDDPFREIARRLGLPEEILPPPPRNLPPPEPPPEPPQPPAPKRRKKPAPEPVVVAEPVPPPARTLQPVIVEEAPAVQRPPLVFHPDPVVNAIIATEVLITPRQRRALRRVPRV